MSDYLDRPLRSLREALAQYRIASSAFRGDELMRRARVEMDTIIYLLMHSAEKIHEL